MKKFKFPNPFTVLYIIIVLSAIATFLMPAGSFSTLSYDAGNFIIEGKENTISLKASQSVLDSLNLKMELAKFEEGKIRKPVSIPNTYSEMESSPQGLMAIVYAPIKGIYESIDIILFVLIIGGFIGVFTASGAFDRGLASLSEKMKGREKWLIVAVMVLVAIGGTTFGMQEETIAFYPILVPIFLAAGYDLIVPVGALYGGSCIGLMGAMINPFETIIASDAAGVSWTLGIYSRLAMLILGGIVVITYVLRYAEKVKKDPKQSLLFQLEIEQPFATLKKTDKVEKLSFKTQLLLVLFGFTFIVMVYGVSSLGWWFEEMTALFLVSALFLGLIIRLGENVFVNAFIAGAKDLLGVALIIGVARGITIVMNDGQISGTILNYASNMVSGVDGLVFLPVLMLVFFVLAFFISSSSGLALVSMPIMGALANVVGVPTEEIVNAYVFGFGLMMFITPAGIILPSLSMVNVPYNIWLKFVWRPMLMMAVIGIGILAVGYLI
ncbi:YfcC family protein [uncultured Roseivirga sp.]|uniref:YfcC family protein n=1 Tax=uncultured Roseivirga sp. TaxID=543088 RepID=UPI0030DCD3C9|tara:strand:- start:166075 stop:167562 length:1488 start_codon:yes stop_codon:yes gene_type:complete